MKKYLSALLSILMLAAGMPAAFGETDNMETAEKIIYVSPDGSDGNSGAEESPLKTLAAAKEAAGRLNDGSADVAVVLRGGEYHISETLRFTAEDGGQNGHKVTWRGYENETPVISGLIEITGWSLYDADKNIFRADVAEGFNTRQLYVDGKKALRARSTSYSGNPYANLNRTCELGLNARNNTELYFYRNEVADWNNYENVEVHLLTAWTDNLLRLAKYDEENNFKLTTVDNGDQGIVDAAAVRVREPESGRLFNRPHPDITGSTLGYKSRSYYYFENAYEFIDEDNEWYLDTAENAIYFKAPEGADMSSLSVAAPALETLVSVCGTAEKPVSGLCFENITFEGSSWLRPGEEGLVGGQACQYVLTSTLDNKITALHPPAAFYAEYARELNITNCVFRKTGATALDLYCGVTDSSVFGNEIYDAAGNGISAAKFVQDESTEYHEAYNPEDKREICSGINIINNSVHDIGTEYEGAVAIAAGYPRNIVIARNEIYNAPYSGISVGFGWTSEDNAMAGNIIYANKIHDIGLVTCDFGAVYTLSKQPQSLCARNCIYNVSRRPWFDYGYTAMYFDEQTEGYTITENLTYNVGSDAWGGGINFNGCSGKNSVKNNYLNVNPSSSAEAAEIAADAGIAADSDCAAIAEEAKSYLADILNPAEPYDETDYYVYTPLYPLNASATAADSGSEAAFAVDGKADTVYTLSGQTADSIAGQYLLIEFDGSKIIDRIVIDRQYNAGGKTTDNNYWADWCLAVGCELQGSLDGESWETVGVMNPWPDGTGETDKEIFELQNPKAYKYIRYIRTKYKTGSDYGVWRWSDDGGNRLNVKEIGFYGKAPTKPAAIVGVSASGCDYGSDPSYAVDNNRATVYTLSGQNEASIGEQYLLIELEGKEPLAKIIIRRQYNAGGKTTDNSYWADWCLAVGCELQGSLDGETWETVGVMNPWPDGTGETSKEIFELQNPKAYKYIRYIRTKYKTGSDYGVWRWSDDGGNRLNVAEIELYTVKPQISAKIISRENGKLTVAAESSVSGEFRMITAVYGEENRLIYAETKAVPLEKFTPAEIEISVPAEGNAAVFFWDENICPLCGKLTD